MRLILLAIGILIIFVIVWDGMRRKKQQARSFEEARHFGGDTRAADDAWPDEANLATAEEMQAASSTPTEAPQDLEAAAAYDQAPSEPAVSSDEPAAQTSRPDALAAAPKAPALVWLTLVAGEEKMFGGFSLLQVLLGNGFRFAEDKLFYYHENREAHGAKLFALAAATEAGTFDLTNMARFHCKGLILFFHPEKQTNLKLAFNEMLDVAENLAEALEADLYIEENTSWTEENIAQLRERLAPNFSG